MLRSSYRHFELEPKPSQNYCRTNGLLLIPCDISFVSRGSLLFVPCEHKQIKSKKLHFSPCGSEQRRINECLWRGSLDKFFFCKGCLLSAYLKACKCTLCTGKLHGGSVFEHRWKCNPAEQMLKTLQGVKKILLTFVPSTLTESRAAL